MMTCRAVMTATIADVADDHQTEVLAMWFGAEFVSSPTNSFPWTSMGTSTATSPFS